MKILFAEIGLESNTFSSELTDLKRWMPGGYSVGEEVIKKFENISDMAGGFIRTGRELGIEMIPTVVFWNAGTLMYDKTRDEAVGLMIKEIKKHLGEFEGIALALHGAGASETCDDLESFTIKAVRDVVGPDIPIVVCLDLHGNISQEMLDMSTMLMGVKTYPHVDFPEIAGKGLRALIATIKGELKPQHALCQVPIIVPQAACCTLELPMKEFADHVAEYAEQNGLIDATIFHGFAYADVPATGISITVVAEQDAEMHAKILGQWVWENRKKLLHHGMMPDEAIDNALEILKQPGEGYVVINESSDNPGGGTPGDGTYLCRELLKRNLPNTIFGSIVDPETARAAHTVGVGGTFSGRLGGKTDNMHGEPIEFENAEVLNLSCGDAWIVAPIYTGFHLVYGKSARIRIGNVEVIVTENLPHQNFDDRVFLMTGADINQYKIICLKSSVHFKGFFAPRAKGIVSTEPPGINTANIHLLDYKKVRRPIFPLEKDFHWKA